MIGRRSRAAISLVEVLVASSILAACMLPVIMFSQRGLTESAHTQNEILGRLLLIDFCERFKGSTLKMLRTVSRDLAANPRHLDGDPLLIPAKSIVPRFLKAITRSISIDENSKGVKGLHVVTFQVTFLQRGGVRDVTRSLFLQRLLHDHDV